jgi:hypothetical protein
VLWTTVLQVVDGVLVLLLLGLATVAYMVRRVLDAPATGGDAA